MQTKTITKGSILIAKPSTGDQFFNRTVILLTEYGEHGAVGFILNKPIHSKLCDYIADFNCEMPVYNGGPVEQENIYYVHTRPDLIAESEQILDELHWSGNYYDVRYQIQNGFLKEDEIRFFLGYSGWSSQQLENEVANGAWEVSEYGNINLFLEWNKNLWQQQMRKLGGENLLWVNAPKNPSLN